MKINEASVIDKKVIDEMIAECENKSDNIFINEYLSIFIEGQLSILKHIKLQLKPLEPIVRDVVDFTYFNNDLWEGVDLYINKTEI